MSEQKVDDTSPQEQEFDLNSLLSYDPLKAILAKLLQQVKDQKDRLDNTPGCPKLSSREAKVQQTDADHEPGVAGDATGVDGIRLAASPMDDVLQRISDSERVIFGVPQGPDSVAASASGQATPSAFTPRARGPTAKSDSAGQDGAAGSGAGESKEAADRHGEGADAGAAGDAPGKGGKGGKDGLQAAAEQLERSAVVEASGGTGLDAEGGAARGGDGEAGADGGASDQAQGGVGEPGDDRRRMRVDLRDLGGAGGDGMTLDLPSGRESRGSHSSMDRPASAGSVLGRIKVLERLVKGLRSRVSELEAAGAGAGASVEDHGASVGDGDGDGGAEPSSEEAAREEAGVGAEALEKLREANEAAGAARKDADALKERLRAAESRLETLETQIQATGADGSAGSDGSNSSASAVAPSRDAGAVAAASRLQALERRMDALERDARQRVPSATEKSEGGSSADAGEALRVAREAKEEAGRCVEDVRALRQALDAFKSNQRDSSGGNDGSGVASPGQAQLPTRSRGDSSGLDELRASLADIRAKADRADRASSQAADAARSASDKAGQASSDVDALGRRVARLEEGAAGDGSNGGAGGESHARLAGRVHAIASRVAGLETAEAALGRALSEVGAQAARMAGVPEDQVGEATREWKGAFEQAKQVSQAASERDQANAETDGLAGATGAAEGGKQGGGSGVNPSSSVEGAMQGLQALLETAAPRARHKADHAELADALRTAREAQDRAAGAEQKLSDESSALREQMTNLANSSLAGGAGGPAASSSAAASPVDDEELERLWGAIESKVDREGLHGLAHEGDVRSKADRTEVSQLSRMLRRLQQELSQLKGKQGESDWAFFAGKPIRDMRCLSCSTVIDPMVEPPPQHLPTGQFPAQQTPSRVRLLLQQGDESKTVMAETKRLPNGQVFNRPVTQSGASMDRDGASRAESGSYGPGSRGASPLPAAGSGRAGPRAPPGSASPATGQRPGRNLAEKKDGSSLPPV